MFIFAHRGLKKEYPENTLSAYEEARKLGFGIELDVRLRPDGELVCIHDRNHEAMWQAPRLEDVVSQVILRFKGNQRAAFHIKEDEQGLEQIQMLLEMFRKYQLYEKAFVFDLMVETAERMKRDDSGIKIALSVGEENYSPTIYTWRQAEKHLHLFDAVWWDEWKIPGSVYTEEMARQIHETGKNIYAISPELHLVHGHPHAEKSGYERDWRNFIQWGIEGVCTAYPREFRAHLDSSFLLRKGGF